MLGDQGDIRAIRVICGENGSEDWPQRGAEGTKAEAGGLTANRRSFRTAEKWPADALGGAARGRIGAGGFCQKKSGCRSCDHGPLARGSLCNLPAVLSQNSSNL